MSLEIIRATLAWCTLIDFGILLLWFLLFTAAHDLLYRFHGRWFAMPVEKFNAIHYATMAAFKCCILIFNLVPYLALRIVG